MALEVDGPVHDEPERAEYDFVRAVELFEMGVKTVRLPAEDVSSSSLRRLVEPLVRLSRRRRE